MTFRQNSETESASKGGRVRGRRWAHNDGNGLAGSTDLRDDDQPGVDGDQLEALLKCRLHLGVGAMVKPEGEQTQDVLQGRSGGEDERRGGQDVGGG